MFLFVYSVFTNVEMDNNYSSYIASIVPADFTRRNIGLLAS